MTGRIILENGMEAVFQLSDKDLRILEQEVEEARHLDGNYGHTVADELALAVSVGWIQHLGSIQGCRKSGRSEGHENFEHTLQNGSGA